ncbi:uncharacterized protein LOC135485060 [Lineus longissimus]|uniref:uncharacterized protein LOC135485060 n=1 Tax=Lineus longissimus TaxID=88925 RepID=UPI002B4DF500
MAQKIGVGLFCCVFVIACLSSEALMPDARKLEKWKEREQKTWCATKWTTSSTSQIKVLVHAAGSHKLHHDDDISYRVCRREDTDCTMQSLLWTNTHRIMKGESTIIMSQITLPRDRVQCQDCVLQWRINKAAGRHSMWRTCHKHHNHQRGRLRRDIAEVTLGPPSFEWTIDSIDLELHRTTPPMTLPPTQPPKPKQCKAVGLWTSVPGMNKWCEQNCAGGYCPPDRCECKNTNPPKSDCRPVGQYATVVGMDNWCVVNCEAGFCPRSHCICEAPGPKGPTCRSKGMWMTVNGMSEWCKHNCAKGNCLKDRCTCFEAEAEHPGRTLTSVSST